MVSTGENFIGSQFFFTLGADLASLDGIHCVIGEVVEGHEVLRQFNEAIVDEKHRPYKDVRVTHTIILEDPYADPRGFRVPSRSPSPSAERLRNGRIAADEDIDDKQGKTDAEIQEMLQDREAKARATILEIVGDLPDADVAPPENVLFVCKLNPVTTDDDLQIIFSRFGKIKTCEVIRDKVSGDSLQYSFIEFEEQKSCEDAYFKMDNVLIDDRRIHVDFSQSVSKIKWRGKGNYTIHDDSDGFKSERKHNRGKREQVNSRRKSRSPINDRHRYNQNNNRNNRNNNERRFDNQRNNSRRQENQGNNQRRFDDRRVNERNYDSRRRSPKRSPVQRKRSPSPLRRSPVHRRNHSPSRRSRSRDRNRRLASPTKSFPETLHMSRDRNQRREASPLKSMPEKRRNPHSSSESSQEKQRKSSHKNKKSSSKKDQRRDRSSSKSRSPCSSKKKSRR